MKGKATLLILLFGAACCGGRIGETPTPMPAADLAPSVQIIDADHGNACVRRHGTVWLFERLK